MLVTNGALYILQQDITTLRLFVVDGHTVPSNSFDGMNARA